MADMMTFPNTWEEFEQSYGITDKEEIYTNGARLIPSFRVKQWLDHKEDEELDFVQEHKKLPIMLEARTKGSWIEIGREEGALGIQYKTLRCPICGWESSLPIPRNFCPECGSDMRGGDPNAVD